MENDPSLPRSLLLGASSPTTVSVYNLTVTPSFPAPETTSSDSMSAEALSEAVAEVNLEHTCDHVKAVFPRSPNILLDLWASSRCRSLCLSSDLKD